MRLALQKSRLTGRNEDGRLFAGINSFSQYHLAYHLLLEGPVKVPREVEEGSGETASHAKPRPSAAPPSDEILALLPWRIVRIGADSLPQLAEAAQRAAGDSASAFEQSHGNRFRPEHRFRLGLVAKTADDLAARLKLAAAQMENPRAWPLLAEKGIFIGEAAPGQTCTALLFPGQGSQYAGMMQGLISDFPPAAEAMRGVDAVLGRLSLPTFAELAWNNVGTLGTDIRQTQFSLLAADTIMFAAVSALGLAADRMSGHSFGELAALVAAGAWSFEDAARATLARCRAIAGCAGSKTALLSTSAPADEVERLCREITGSVFVSHRNAPDQTVAGGEADAVTELARRVEQAGHKTKLLAVPVAFHTPLMQGTQEPFRRGLESIALAPPRVPLLSSVTNRYVAEPSEIRENLILQMTQPVNYGDLVERLIAEGVTALVEVGPKQVLTGLHKRVAGD
ncbi:MAG: ACP S-malonyltransferase, partial [Planctomycetaceae bacterium]